jgi:hypothetical protein
MVGCSNGTLLETQGTDGDDAAATPIVYKTISCVVSPHRRYRRHEVVRVISWYYSQKCLPAHGRISSGLDLKTPNRLFFW